MKMLITGGTGQLGRAFSELTNIADVQLFSFSSRELNVTDTQQIRTIFNQIRPDAVIHAGAFTAVDAAESQADAAFKVNVTGTRNIAAACLHYSSKLIYISTDYVFDGKSSHPYTEFDQPNPLNIYGRSKLEGEKIAARICPRLYIVRTSWLYGLGHNFIHTILKLAKEREFLTIVNDQIGSPTNSLDLAQGIMTLVHTWDYGTYHMSNKGQCTWHEFAREIVRLTGQSVDIRPISTAELALPAARPAYSVLRNYMLELAGGDYFRSWQEGLQDYIKK
ncbi:dTDP-4-dehydrorhamnose reductase [Sporomusa termitida]|uniref:dTDP-4-dehydrorhamnose reductase n=1 Tax=Sporomusa termitida TaxID=2377 RepID=A0A517DZN9_9FIRM|nr:dTDP-4-dehydrorhamnose reductase [Sporomusa termitida]QDR82788.1 dTDP-4-dehydrorhamnose reductase [Sporomusa termitida]